MQPNQDFRGRKACPVCASAKVRLFVSKTSKFSGHTHSYFKCDHCGYLWVDPFPGYGIYDARYYRGEGPDPYVDYENEYNNYQRTDRPLEFDDILRIARETGVIQAAPGGSWHDFGCGSGSLLKYLRDQQQGGALPAQLELSGSDTGYYAKRLKEFDGFEIYSPSDLSQLDQKFDVISCIEVIEHLENPRETIQLLGRLLRPGGVLILTTGNLKSVAAKIAGPSYRYMLPEIHVNLFNPEVLARLYVEAGLRPFAVSYRGMVSYKVIKSLQRPGLKRLARVLFKIPLCPWLVDKFYGVSAMPCARKERAS